MPGPMEGVRVLELAQFTFVPASGAVLADWGADVIKVEHIETGDSQRALVNIMGLDTFTPTEFFPIMEAPNRGKRSIGLDLASEGGRKVLEALIAKADVFVTNFRAETRQKLRIEVEDVRAINPTIIYFRGTGQGVRGPDGPLGGYDQTSFWARTGIADSITPSELGRMIPMPTGAFGDNIGGMTIAGGIAAALFKRAMTGEPSVIDVSLLSVGMWAASYGINHSLLLGEPLPPVPLMDRGLATQSAIRWAVPNQGRPIHPDGDAAAGQVLAGGARPARAAGPRGRRAIQYSGTADGQRRSGLDRTRLSDRRYHARRVARRDAGRAGAVGADPELPRGRQ